ncbi:MAG TPA: serine hydrolase [Ktedonobacteraceae bacterium]
MPEQPKNQCSSQYQIFFSLSYIHEIFSAILLSLILIVSPVNTSMYSSSTHNTDAFTQSIAKTTPAWVLMDDTGIYATPVSFPAIARVSQHTPVFLTGYWQIVNKTNWVQVMWHTGTQSHTGWIQANSLTKQSFSGISSASIGMLSARLQGYLTSLGSSVGVAVYIPSTNQYYLYNASQEFPTASSIKIPIMLTLLYQVEQQKRSLLDNEAQLLQAMIESSDNDAAESLYQEIGAAAGMNSFLSSHGLSGIVPDPNTWGTSTASPQAMVHLLATLSAGELLSMKGTSYALSLMQNIAPDQRFGIGDTAPQGAIVSIKDGWLALDQGWAVNSSGIVQAAGITYIVSVYTTGQPSQETGMQLMNTTCQQIATALI